MFFNAVTMRILKVDFMVRRVLVCATVLPILTAPPWCVETKKPGLARSAGFRLVGWSERDDLVVVEHG